MDESLEPSQERSVNEALTPITPTKRGSSSTSPTPSPIKRQRLVVAPCPICGTRMPTLMVPYHLDRCKPRKVRPSKLPPQPPSLHFVFKAPQMTAVFTQAEPKDTHSYTFGATVALRSFKPPTTLHLHATTPPPHPIPQLPVTTPAARLPLSLLKSALQKSVRRGRPWPALRIAIVLLRRRAVFELLRRLTIIILEDAMLHPAYPSLVFLLAASSKDHILSLTEVVHVLKVIYDVAAVPKSDPLSESSEEDSIPQNHNIDLITALQIRVGYGGMQCDTQLLRRTMHAWYRRSNAQNWRSQFDVYDFETTTNEVTAHRVSTWLQADDPVLRPGDIPLEAWDFHCCSVADDIIAEITTGKLKGKLPRFEKLSRARDIAGVFKGLMWRFWSGVNHKEALTLNEEPSQKRQDESRKNDSVYDIAPHVVANAETEETLVWKEELCPQVLAWCKRYRKRYGL